jgi:ATP adenylyltransferase
VCIIQFYEDFIISVTARHIGIVVFFHWLKFEPIMFFDTSLFRSVTNNALKSGELIPTQVNIEEYVENDQTFIIYENIATKRKENNIGTVTYTKRVDPFRPFDPLLHISSVNNTHELVLNKFVVVKNHALLITTDFQPQTSDLNKIDFDALQSCVDPLKSDNWLIFYNCGMKSGASQPHKHIQIVPLWDLDTKLRNFPLQEKLDKFDYKFPFLHALVDVSGKNFSEIHDLYVQALRNLHLNVRSEKREVGMVVTCPVGLIPEEHLVEYSNDDPSYNVLFTINWLLVIPRREENFKGISFNSIGFLNSIYVGSQDQLKLVKDLGISKIVQELTFPN